MSQSLLINPTAFEAGMIAAAQARAANGAAHQAAIDRFMRTGLPHRRMEGWRWSDFRAALRTERSSTIAVKAFPSSHFAGLNPIEIRIVNGVPNIHSDVDIEGLRIYSGKPAMAPEYLDGLPIVALNETMADSALAVIVEDGVAIERPILIRHIATSGAKFSQARVTLGKRSKARFIETYESSGGAFLSAVTHVSARAHAQVGRYVFQISDEASVLDGVFAVSLSEGVVFDQTGVALGAKLARLETHVLHADGASQARLSSAALLSGSSHADFTSRIYHAASKCTTRQKHKAVMTEKARGVFQGKFRVERAGQQTDAKMTANALLLSDEAEADHKPELEIYADDVECAHGSTTGALDEDALFYLRARGLDEQGARALLIEAFLADVFDDVTHDGVRGVFRECMEVWLGGVR